MKHFSISHIVSVPLLIKKMKNPQFCGRGCFNHRKNGISEQLGKIQIFE